MKIELEEKEANLLLDAIDLWLDSVSVYDYSAWTDEPEKFYNDHKQTMEKAKERISKARLPF